jgi:hypothetical protein
MALAGNLIFVLLLLGSWNPSWLGVARWHREVRITHLILVEIPTSSL